MRALANTLFAVAALVVVVGSPSAARADTAQLADAMLVLNDAGDDYLALRDSLLTSDSVSDEELEALADHPDWRVRVHARILLGWRADPQLFAAVAVATPMPARRRVFLRFVDDFFSDPAAAPAVIERTLHGGESDKVRAGLVTSLVRLGDEWSEDLLGLLGEVEETDVRVAIVSGFRKAEPAAAHQGLRIALADADPILREEAARSTGWRADGAALADDLLVTLQDDDPGARAFAARALGWLLVAEAAGPLQQHLADPDPRVRLHALRSIDRVSPTTAVALPTLDAMTADPDPKVARVAKRIKGRQLR